MKKFILGTLAGLLISSSAFSWHQLSKVEELKVANGNKTLIKFQGIPYHSCGGSHSGNPNPFFLISEGDNVSDQRKQMLSLALTALVAGKDVWVTTGGTQGDTPQCSSSGYEWVYQISIYP